MGMTILNRDQYLKPISDAEPCGDALDYDLSFLELEMASRGKSAQEIGAAWVAGEPPNWAEVARLSRELGNRSKDLRVAVLAARAGLNLDGLARFRDALDGLAIYVETFWAAVHPRPDAEDGDDDTVRFNVMANLCDPEGLLAELRRTPLTESRMFGKASLRDHVEAQRTDPAVVPDTATIESSFLDTERDILEARSADLRAILETATRLDTALQSHSGTAEAIRLSPLLDVLRQMQALVDDHLPSQPVAVAPSGTAPAAPASLDIHDRNDIIVMLDRMCRWYRVNEPGSPVPAMLERVRRLVSKDFMALLLELAPEGAAQFRAIAGLTADGEHRGA